jgi:hypothetical protein
VAGTDDADRMRERAGENRLKLWVLMDAPRWQVTVGLLAVVFGSLVAAGSLAPVSLGTAASSSDPIETLFQALVTAIITGVTLVVTITQLVLSQELGPVGDQRERMEGSTAFRSDVAGAIDAPISPAQPADFLQALVDATEVQAAAVVEALSANVESDSEACDRVTEYTDGVIGNARTVSDRLDGAEFGTFGVVSAALDYNYSEKIYDGQRLRAECEGALPEEARTRLERLIETLRLFGPAREHFKTLYFQWELADLSRAILYAAVPALVVAVVGVLLLEAPGVAPGTTGGVDNLLLVVSGATTVAVAPFALLLAYILRIVTVTKRTLAIGPFVLREQ